MIIYFKIMQIYKFVQYILFILYILHKIALMKNQKKFQLIFILKFI